MTWLCKLSDYFVEPHRVLQLGSCGLTGTIPLEIGLLINLGFLSLGYNSFLGTLPSTISLLQKLT